jgi:hypothetical protein
LTSVTLDSNVKKFLAALCACVKSKTVSQPDPQSPFSDPTPSELEMVTDAAHIAEHGHSLKRKASQGVTDMQARIDLLTGQKRLILDQIEEADPQIASSLTQQLNSLNTELREAQDRLAGYQTQLQGLN